MAVFLWSRRFYGRYCKSAAFPNYPKTRKRGVLPARKAPIGPHCMRSIQYYITNPRFSPLRVTFKRFYCEEREGGDCSLRSRGFRAQPEAECPTRRPPNECEVREEWVRVCGSCHRRLKRKQDLELLAAVRGDTQQATPHVVRRRPTPCAVLRSQAEPRPEEHEPKGAETYKGFIHGVSRVYGDGGVPRRFRSVWRCLSQDPTQL